MTRTLRIIELLAQYRHDVAHVSSNLEPTPALAARILAIADEGRHFVVVLDIARQIGRGRETVRSWADRGTWDFPAPAGTLNSSGAGPTRFWDAEVITAWIAEHPGLQGREA